MNRYKQKLEIRQLFHSRDKRQKQIIWLTRRRNSSIVVLIPMMIILLIDCLFTENNSALNGVVITVAIFLLHVFVCQSQIREIFLIEELIARKELSSASDPKELPENE